MPLIPALRRQRQTDLCEFKASLIYKARQLSRTAGTSQGDSSQKKKKGKERKIKVLEHTIYPSVVFSSTQVCVFRSPA